MASGNNTNVLGGIKAAAKGIHGVGETLRGTFNSAIDDLAHDETGRAKNDAVRNKGLSEMESMSGAGTRAVPPVGNTTTGARTSDQQTGAPHVAMDGAGMGGTGSRGTTTYDTIQNPSTYSNNGPHSSKVGNTLDPRVDSTTGQTNTSAGYSNNPSPNVTVGPHSSNLMNRVDPTVDSQTDYTTNTGRNNAGYGGHVGGATTTANDGFANNPNSTNAGPHSSNLMNKLDPRVDSDTGYATNAGAGSSSRY